MEPPLSDRRILILEDEQILYRFVEAYFAELGPRNIVSSAGSVSAAIEIFKRSPIDLGGFASPAPRQARRLGTTA